MCTSRPTPPWPTTSAAAAHQVGRRKAGAPVIVVVRAAEAHAAGTAFYRGNELVWLTDFVPPGLIEIEETSRSGADLIR